MKILAILQNQWFHNPEGIKRMYDEHPDRRNRYIEAFLFMGCLTGRRLKAAFGEDLCGEIIWEEASPKIAGLASACFPPDPAHISNAITKFKPDIVITFGKIARDGIERILKDIKFNIDEYEEMECRVALLELGVKFWWLVGPHPASRTDPMPRLREMAERVKVLIKEQNKPAWIGEGQEVCGLPIGNTFCNFLKGHEGKCIHWEELSE